MLIYKILENVILEIDYATGKNSSAELWATVPNTQENIHLNIEIDNCGTIQMMMDTIDSSVQDHLGLKYVTETSVHLQADLTDELDSYIASLPLKGELSEADTIRTD